MMDINKWTIQIVSPDLNELSDVTLAKMAADAFGRSFNIRKGDFDVVDAAFLATENDGAPQVAGNSPHYYVSLSPYLFEVVDLAIDKGRMIAISYTPSVAFSDEIEGGFRWTGKLAAQMVRGRPVDLKLNRAAFDQIQAAIAVKIFRCNDPLAGFEALVAT
jgi:hypothetical protein